MQERRSGAVVSLHTAVRRIFAVVYRDEPATTERLAGLANAVAAIVPVYVRAARGELRAIHEDELRDEKVDCAELLVSRTSVEHAIEMLKACDDPSLPPANGAGEPGRQRKR
jgi:hypothetical protein